MGHRANFVLIREGNARAFHDQWAALGSTWAFAGGPAAAVSAAEQSSPTSELLDWAFTEAGYLLDFDEKQAIVFGYPELPDFDLGELEGIEGFEGFDSTELEKLTGLDAALQRGPLDFLRAIAPRWEGWLLCWDDRGVDAFAAHLARRGISSIAAQPPGDRIASSAVSFQA
jgi:hypothetical protein